jgi:hypothetical protein
MTVKMNQDFTIPGTGEEFSLWCQWSDNAIRIPELLESKQGEYGNSDLQLENERVSLILKSMEIKEGIDYIRNMWEIRFSDDELYGIFVLKF